MKIRVSLCGQNGPPPPPKPLIYMSTNSNCAILSVSDAVRDTAHLCLSLVLQFTVVWSINTGLWNKQKLLTRKVFSAVLYLYTSDKSDAQNPRYPQKLMFKATGGPTDMPPVVLGQSVRVVG